ncbi:uncharacterized protein EAF02_002214 [Botrytis sinoallii]|uniref:uncharacterized protein n=1 Tax=Botrytis sinoallii TaxID=1463999 RepID=UPI0019018AC2|nr:uncharacterized protein EAF02_002214 [Botrytis sinoallii]KAF7889799.1 hypothetical protein EAF02_002214 [Botrytis sinoallii]
MSSRARPDGKVPDDLTHLNSKNKRAKTFPEVHDPSKVNPARNKIPRVPMPDSTSSSSNSNRTAESGVRDHERGKGRGLVSMLGRRGAHQSARNHAGEEMNGEDGKAKGKKKTSRDTKKIKKSGGLAKLIVEEGERKEK